MYKNDVDGRHRAALTAVAVAQFLVALDMAVMNVALPAIRADLGFAPVDLSWVVHVYALTFGGFLLLGGRACDLVGRRRVFVVGLMVFGAASAAGGFAQAPWQLVAARAVQGVAAAAIAPATLATLTTTFTEGRARARALAVWSATNAVGGAGGVLLGGVLTEYADWRWVMWINIPFVLLALAAVLAGVTADRRAAARDRLDVFGALLATAGVGLLVIGVVRTDHVGWTSPVTLATLAAAAALLACFVAVETRVAAPLVRLSLLGSRWAGGAHLFVFLAGAGQFAAFYLASLYMQQVLGMSAGATGVAFLPFSLAVVVGTVLALRLGAVRAPRGLIVAGGSLAAVGMGWFALISPDGSVLTDVLGPALFGGLGMGLCLAPVAGAATIGVPAHEAGMASGVFNSARQLGGSVGVAALATVAAARTGGATDPAALNSGYALGLAVTAALFALAAIAAAVVLPAKKPTDPTTSGEPRASVPAR
ncbi:MFS transporter [Nocardia farcinica]|uniref:MFS transporter n=1 Tax=Nocardia farcinica TaxID=37329 RepID=UPI0018954E2F|nr:MFS transporter [Nocardia farcinica]MBF6521072.1 MFS transporter [Nocardia farcinica]